ncbi:MAG: ADP-dependent glucokinase/phosphofructokinase [Alphaproteobacteria bacterium]|nr:ADP-dependent glucokinase/phosphofructokinase [Alphaproteobacteria bacterium]
MDTADLKKIWLEKYKIVPEQLKELSNINSAVTAFNANIDAVIKMSAQNLKKLIEELNLSLQDLQDIKQTKIYTPQDVVKGIFKCFTNGIAEEWITEDKDVYDWLNDNIGYDRLQIGGQGGIVANALATVGIKKVVAHTNSLPKLQADQFVKKDNLLSFDENGNLAPAYSINRENDVALIHWIIEFDRGDVLLLEGKKFTCPKSNRFIATYDPLNLKLVIDKPFMDYVQKNKTEYVILSGFHALTSNNDGVKLIENIVPELKKWKENNKEAIFHLEIASTQDVEVRKAIVNLLVPLMDSIGINERETIDVLEALSEEKLARLCKDKTTAENLFAAIVKIKEKLQVKRIQLHMFGLYVTLQDTGFKISPEQNLKGMMTASTVAAAKAGTGTIDNLLFAYGYTVSDVGLIETSNLATSIGQNDLDVKGIGRYRQWDLIVVPTILIEKPITLVGMGDTISSISLVAAR